MSDSERPKSTQRPIVTPFFDEQSNTFSYVVADPASSACAVIDSVLDFDYASGSISHAGADALIAFIRESSLSLQWIIETHAHADHLSAGHYIREQIGGVLAIGEDIQTVQRVFGDIFNLDSSLATDGSQFDHLFKDGETYFIGELEAHVMHTPGHTPACMSHLIGDALFVGDTLFLPDSGTARADFPGGDAKTLYRSIHKLLELPGETRVFMCHDYGVEGRDLQHETTIQEERDRNIHVNSAVSEEQFVRMRTERDKTLGMPELILPSLQVNIRAGELPAAENNGRVYLKVPIGAFDAGESD